MIVFERRASGILHNLARTLPGDRPFMLPANVCPAVVLALRKARRRFRMVDIDPADFGLDRGRCLELLAERPDAWGGVIYVRPYGAVTADVDLFFHAAKRIRRDLLIVDDRCLSAPDCGGAALDATAADVTLFSTGRAKPVDLGYGGFAHCRTGTPYRRCESPYPGEEDWLDLSPPDIGWTEYRSAVEEALVAAADHRARLNAIYARLPEEIRLAERFQGWRFHVRVPEPDRLVADLFAAGLFASRHYPSLGGVFSDEQFPEAERLHRSIVNLFNDRYFDEARAERAVEIVLRHR